MELLLAPQNWPFSLSLALVAALSALQIVMALLGGAIHVMDGDLDADFHGHVEGDFFGGLVGDALDWLHIGKIPFTILLILEGLCFGLAGIGLQSLLAARGATYLPAGTAALFAFLLSLPLLRLSGLALRPILPRDESEAVSSDSFLGCEAEITIGTARRGQPTEAKLRDKWGKTHYVLVEPEHEAQFFPTGSRVLLLTRREHIFRVIEGTGVDD
ncbi:DUF1449 family protein [bacterium]|nr:MAG: DUF1449 family protein [bacterium]